jgi:hypothetical protein
MDTLHHQNLQATPAGTPPASRIGDEVFKLVSQAKSLVYLIEYANCANAVSHDLDREHYTNAAWTIQDLLDRIVLVVEGQEVRHD